ncbi:olfactory receptor 52E8-like [Brienomyrus brachyistius]|uniref:olfactory receptor 52E8-like n=1 Tax=Brienomyrus brachyistius TaxID=42636 RepID=UPI0020B1DE46|nr:olfactory receptor 52E8-like [Brienomyrus brachyistius]
MSDIIFSNATANSIIRPQYFQVTGFSTMPHAKYYFIFLCFVYAITLLGNSFVTLIIYIDRSLHTPKYIAIFSLAVADLGESTALISNLFSIFLFNTEQIAYGACLTNVFFVFFFNSVQSIMLTVLAYDRFVAICFPLRYHSILTTTSMAILITVGWVFNFLFMLIGLIFLTRLSFCKSTLIYSYFCDYGPMVTLACNDRLPSAIITRLYIVFHLFLPMSVIGLSYAFILLALFKITSWEERLKALKTCFSHLFLVSVFYGPLLVTFVAGLFTPFHPNTRIITTSLSYAIPAMLNPIVYSLNTVQIKDFARKMFRRSKPRIFAAFSK